MQKITLNSQDTPFTIDMYQTFNGDTETEQMIEYYNEENKTELDYDDFYWKFNKQAIANDIANASVEYINTNVLDDVIKSVKRADTETYSPKFYNYQTDSYDAIYTIDVEKLRSIHDFSLDYGTPFAEYIGTNRYVYKTATDTEQIEWELMYHLKCEHESNETYFLDVNEISSETMHENTEMKLITNK